MPNRIEMSAHQVQVHEEELANFVVDQTQAITTATVTFAQNLNTEVLAKKQALVDLVEKDTILTEPDRLRLKHQIWSAQIALPSYDDMRKLVAGDGKADL